MTVNDLLPYIFVDLYLNIASVTSKAPNNYLFVKVECFLV